MERKFVFAYFSKKALCSTPEEAIAFIDSLKYQNRGKITCNETCKRKIDKLFAGDKTFTYCLELATTGCSNTRIRVCPANADTLKEHERISAEIAQKEEAERLCEECRRVDQKNEQLDQKKHGWYLATLSFEQWRLDRQIPYYYDFHVRVLAESGRDAYYKLTKYFDSRDLYPLKPSISFENKYPDPSSVLYEFDFMREASPDDPDKEIIILPN